MILLDTSVLSEAMKPEPDAIVLGWLDAQTAESLYITSISVAELLAGIGVLPDGPSKDGLAKALDRTLQMFSGRMLTFETMAAWSYADLAVKAIKRGKSYATADMYIAAIAAAHGLPVASRSAPIFESLDILAIDPWQA
jgi:toxin FitB